MSADQWILRCAEVCLGTGPRELCMKLCTLIFHPPPSLVRVRNPSSANEAVVFCYDSATGDLSQQMPNVR